MTRVLALSASVAVLALAACGDNAGGQSGGAGGARTQVWVAGSSTVFPFATRVSETLSRKSGAPAAKVESLGTGGGFKLFCSGSGSAYPDVATASREMTASEFDQCAARGVTDIAEIKIGYDGIVIVNASDGAKFDMKASDIYMALAAETPSGDSFAPNAARTWRDVSPSLPDQRINVYGPPPTSGTRDAFVELGMEGGASQIAALKALKSSNEGEFKQRTHLLRTDGAWIDSGENDNAIIGSLTKTPGSVGVVGYSFLENNRDKVKAASIDGVQPTLASIGDGSYPLARSMFIYVKKANLPLITGLKEYVAEFVSEGAGGKGGYLLERGLIPLHDDERSAQVQAASTLPTMTKPGA